MGPTLSRESQQNVLFVLHWLTPPVGAEAGAAWVTVTVTGGSDWGAAQGVARARRPRERMVKVRVSIIIVFGGLVSLKAVKRRGVVVVVARAALKN